MDFSRALLYVAVDRGIPPLLGEVSENWGANQQNHRQKIQLESRQALHASISHSPMRGGYIGLGPDHPKDLQLGFDLEEVDRVTEDVVRRVSHPRDEIPGAGEETPALLWSAREAAFKSLRGPSQPQVISQIRFFDWKKNDQGLWGASFESSGTSPGKVFSWRDEESQFAIALWTPQSQFEKGCRE